MSTDLVRRSSLCHDSTISLLGGLKEVINDDNSLFALVKSRMLGSSLTGRIDAQILQIRTTRDELTEAMENE